VSCATREHREAIHDETFRPVELGENRRKIVDGNGDVEGFLCGDQARRQEKSKAD
jgi:hypothetical protein